ncbi:hypothetical protein EV121DRAFT_173635, partial [Schizophyllum commune]
DKRREAGKREQPRYTPSSVDYEAKYAPDVYGEELSSKARVWNVYNDEAQIVDAEMVKTLNGTIDVLLVFAGLFSAVVTTFVAQNSQKLGPDYAQMTASFMYELTRVQRAIAAGTSVDEIPATQPSFASEARTAGDVWVNGLWLSSLTLSLLTSLVSVLAKQWIQRWKVPFIIGFLPVLLNTALLLFLAGLAVYIAPLNSKISSVVVGISAATAVIYAATVVLPILIPSCAYKTPMSDYVLILVQLVRWPYKMLRDIIRDGHVTQTTLDGPWTGHSSHLKYLESTIVQRLHDDLMIAALDWLCSSSLNASAANVSVQAASAFPGPLGYSKRQWESAHRLCEEKLRTLELKCRASTKLLVDRADIVERWARTFLHSPRAFYLTSKMWRAELWTQLYNSPQRSISQQAEALLRLVLLVRLSYKGNALCDRGTIESAQEVLDTTMFSAPDLQLHPIVW